MLALNPGETFAGCRIVDICGHGGFGTVYLAENAVGRRIAVKIVNAVDQEAELQGIRLYMENAPDSPYLLPILHVGIERGELYYLMDAADPIDPASPVYLADTLGRRLKLRGRLTPDEALKIAHKLALAVEALHRAQLIHRDIKPDNVIFVNGEPQLSDPGLLRPAECSATLAGTLGFLPPEVLSGAQERNGMAGDLYALGKVFYCMFTGENPGHYPYLPRDLGASTCRKLLPILLKVCSDNPRKRFADITEFRRALPEKLPGPGPLERLGEKIRMWKLMHSTMYHTIIAAALALLLLGAWGAWQFHRFRREQAELQASLRRETAELTAHLNEGGAWLELQLERVLGIPEAQALLRTSRKLPQDPAAALEHCRRIRSELRQAALACAETAKRAPDMLKRSGYIRELLGSPLGGFLTKAERRKLAQELRDDEMGHPSAKSQWTPRPGRTYSPNSSRIFEFAYIPPGDFISPRTRKRCRIDYPMWVGTTEMSGLQFSQILKYTPAGNHAPDSPVTRIVFNDLMHACRQAKEFFELIGTPLPRGYVVRPLSEEEWEYCALSGMRDGIRTAAPGGANRFGLFNIYDGVREIVLTDDRKCAGAYVVRGGGDGSSPEKALAARDEIAFYQSFMPNTGARLAIAPGDDRLFEREFRSSEICHFTIGGIHYEFFGQLSANIPIEDAAELCTLLGGRLAVLDNEAVLARLRRTASPVFRYPVLSGAIFRDGAWRWQSSGEALKDPPRPPGKDESLMMENGRFRLHQLKSALGFVCEWNENEWRRRSARGSSGAIPRTTANNVHIRAVFEIAGTRYVLIRTPVLYPHLARRFAELLGGRLAEPESPELRREIAAAMGKHAAHPAFVGGIWKYGAYQWLGSGHPIRGPLPLAGIIADNARSLAAPAIMNGDLCAAQMTTQFLVEFPTRSASRR